MSFAAVKLVPKSCDFDEVHLEELTKNFGEEIAHNDYLVEFIALYPEAVVDKNGTNLKITKEMIIKVAEVNNHLLSEKQNHWLSKIKTVFKKKLELSEIDFIPMICDHDTSNVHNVTGYTRDTLKLGEVDGKTILTVSALITDDKTKYLIKKGLIKNVSVGLRSDYSLKEISFVTNPALKEASLLSEGVPTFEMSENQQNLIRLSEVSQSMFKLQEDIDDIYKDGMIDRKLDKLIESGKMLPRSVDFVKSKLINLSEPEVRNVLSAFELSTPATELGLAFNKNFNFTVLGDMLMSTEATQLEKALNNLNRKTKKNAKDVQLGESTPAAAKRQMPTDTSRTSLSEDDVKSKWKQYKELSEKDPKAAKKMLAAQCGEEEEEAGDNKELSEAKQAAIDLMLTEFETLKAEHKQLIEKLAESQEGVE